MRTKLQRSNKSTDLPNNAGGSTSRTDKLEDACEPLDSVLCMHLSLLLSLGMSKGRSLKSTLVALPEVVASCCISNRLLRSFGMSNGRSDSSGSLSTRLMLSSCGFNKWKPNGLHLIPARDSIEIPLSEPWISASPDDEDCSAKLIRFLFWGVRLFLNDVSNGEVTEFVLVFVFTVLVLFDAITLFSVTFSSGDAFCELLLRLLSEVSEAGSWDDLSEIGESIWSLFA